MEEPKNQRQPGSFGEHKKVVVASVFSVELSKGAESACRGVDVEEVGGFVSVVQLEQELVERTFILVMRCHLSHHSARWPVLPH